MLRYPRESIRCFKWAFWLVVCIAFHLGAPLPPLAAQGSTANVDLIAYRAELDRLAAAVNRLEQHPEEGQAIRDSLPKKWIVNDQGTTYEVSTARLAEDLDHWQKDQWQKDSGKGSLDSLKRRIQALQAEADAFTAGLSPSSSARQKLQQILSRKEFGSADGPTWLDRALGKIAQWIDRLHLHLPSFGRAKFPSWSGWLIISIVIGGVCLALAFVLWKLITRTQENLELNLSGGEQFHKQSREWVSDALSAARRGDYRSAIRCAYWAAVFRLEELGRWAPNRTLTPREYLRMLPRDHFQRPPLADLTQRFELTWYGYAVATARDFDQVTEQLEKLGCLAPSAAATQKS